MSETLSTIRRLVEAGHLRVSEHGRQELSNDGISLSDVISSIDGASVVEDYPNYAKGPSVLCLQHDRLQAPVHVLWGLAKQSPHIATLITAYRPDPSRWQDDFKTRKPK